MKIEEFYKRVIPYLQGFDLVGTGSQPPQWEIDDINEMLKQAYDETNTPEDHRSYH